MLKRLKQMQIKSKTQEGYITIYLALTLGVMLPLLFALIEGVAAGTARVQAQLVAELGVDSIFAEYHKELYRQYGLFFIDDSYGTANGSVSMVENRLQNYLSYNTMEEKEKEISDYLSFQKLKTQYLEIEEVAFATDEAGKVWKAQAIQLMKERYGIDALQKWKSHMQVVEENALLTTDIEASIQQSRKELHETIERRQEELGEEVGKEKEEDTFSYHRIQDALDGWMGQGVLSCVLPEGKMVSQMTLEQETVLSRRYQEGQCNQGRGLKESVESSTGLEQELLYTAYIMQKYGSFLNPKEDSHLAYEIEYILFGGESDRSNLQTCTQRLLMLRTAANYLYLTQKDPVKKAQARAICTAICSFCMVPEMSEVLTQLTLGLWAYGESVMDVKCLLKGGKVSLMKDRDEWQVSLHSLVLMDTWNTDYGYGSKKTTALSYQDYLRIFLLSMDTEQKLLRSMDVVELDIRKTAGNQNFRLDQCIDTILVSFGFTDQYDHDYVFTRKMRYE